VIRSFGMRISRTSNIALAVMLVLFLAACENQQSNTASSNSSAKSSAKQSQIKDYNTARPLLWSKVYPRGGKTLYCGERFDSQQRRGFNVEHVFPMSWATNGLKCGKRKQCRAKSKRFNQIEADLHNLFPSRADVNQDRSSFRFGEVAGESRAYGRSCDFEVNTRQRVAEPTSEVRGDVARAMFYMADRYKGDGLILFKKQAELLERWHRLDPPSAEERRRNEIIETLQGNRNQFIDDPERLHRLIRSGRFF